MKYLTTYKLFESVDKRFVMNFLTDFGLSSLLSVIRKYIIYIEPRVKKFVTDKPLNGINYKEAWLNRIEKIKNDYKLIVTQ